MNLMTKKNSLKKKLASAVAMLLISAVLMTSATYAWFVMSTAPEVSGIATQVGANGALEIALLNASTWENTALLDAGDFDESASGNASGNATSNDTWGNLVSLSDNSVYGLDKITLMPARLNIKESGNNDDGSKKYSIGNVLLKTPSYGVDGRIESLKEEAVSSTFDGTVFPASGAASYGVRAIGTSSDLNANQLALNTAKNAIVTKTSEARTLSSDTLNAVGPKLANIVMEHALNEATESYDTADIDALIELANGLKSALDKIDEALRQVFVGYVNSEDAELTEDEYTAALAKINDKTVKLSTLLASYSDLSAISSYITILENDITSVNNAITTCTNLKASGSTFTWAQIVSAMTPLCNYDKMTLNGKSVDSYSTMSQEEAVSSIMGGDITIGVPTGSGIISDIADFAGNYTAKVVIASVSYGGYSISNLATIMQTVTSVSPVYLTACGNILKGYTAASGGASAGITDYFGYAVDLAFRTNAEGSNLLLQTEPENRIYEGDDTNTSIQGAGSYMQFHTSSGISATKLVKLMSAIRIVFMDEDNGVLAIAKLDTTLGKNVYTELSTEQKIETGMYAYLDGGVTPQISDNIDINAYNALPDTSNVEFDGKGNVKAKIYLYEFSMPNSAVNTDQKTGGLEIGAKKESQTITGLTADTPEKVTTIVYLDGSVVTNAMVAANATYSMTGTLNLQFSSSATLIPAENYTLRTGGGYTPATDDQITTLKTQYAAIAGAGNVIESNKSNIYVKDDVYYLKKDNNFTAINEANLKALIGG